MPRRKGITAGELLDRLERDPAYQARMKEKHRRRQEFEAMLDKDEQPLVQDLRQVGLNVQSVWDLVNAREKYLPAIPVLVEHLQRPYHPRTKAGIARALTVKEAKQAAWDVMVSEFKKAETEDRISEPSRRGLKSSLENALEYLADKTKLDDLLELVADPRHGKERTMLVRILYRYPQEKVVKVLQGLRGDPDVASDAEKALERIAKKLAK